jgi:TonB-dependent receptor-like protein
MTLGNLEEEIVVIGQQGLISETGTGATTITAEELEGLPVERNVIEMVNLAPGVADTGFSVDRTAPSIGGAPTYENLWLVNGVVINENIRAEILPLFIEDAVQESTTAISGISAEYGRFTGGLVNTITKSGGNQYHGSFRVSAANEDWEEKTPLTTLQEDEINEIYEATLGGFAWKDHIWFFGAGRDRDRSLTGQTSTTNISFPQDDSETRYEGKLTITPHPSHTLVGSYLEIERTRTNTTFGTILDLRSVNPPRDDPQEIEAYNYTGILTSSFFVEAQYSERTFGIGQGSGGPQDLIDGTMIRTRGQSFRYWAPTFCGACEDEARNNDNLLAKASYFLSTGDAGTHDIVFGYDTFDDIRFAINHQTGSDFTVYGSDVVRNAAGQIVLDPTFGSPIPVFNPAASDFPRVEWFAVYNLDLARPTSFKTNSYYVNDKWQIGDRWGVNLGVRYDQNDGKNSTGVTVADDSKISPRVGIAFDLKGDGGLVFNANYGTYVSSLNNAVADGSTSGGAIGDFVWRYDGPAINVGCLATNSCVASDEVLRRVFAWYESLGGVYDLGQVSSTAPIFSRLVDIDVPGATTQVVGGITSPSVEEITLGMVKRLGTRGVFRADVILREWDDFYGRRTTIDTGKVTTASGAADVSYLGNFANGVERDYQGLLTQFRYRVSDRFSLAGNYTLAEAEGNYLGEGGATAADEALIESYPQYRQASWHIPDGDLRIDQRHKVRAWGIYDLFQGDHHQLSVSWLENYFSGSPYGASRNVNPSPFVTNPGYETPATSVLYWFTDRDAFHTDDIHRSDLAINYSFNIDAWGKNLEIFLQPEVLNVFNEQGVIDPEGLDENEGVVVAGLQSFNFFTTTPVEGVNWRKGPNFGKPLNELDYQDPRTFRFSVGIRF